MTYYSPGVEYLCPKCNSNQVRFIFEQEFVPIVFVEELIRAKNVSLSTTMTDYYNDTKASKWICYDCYDCGVVLY